MTQDHYGDAPGPYEEDSIWGEPDYSFDDPGDYTPPQVPVGHYDVIRFARESGTLPSFSIRSLAVLIAHYAKFHGDQEKHQYVAEVPTSVLCELTGKGSPNTIRAWTKLIEGVGIFKIYTQKGGNDRVATRYVFLGDERNWEPLPMEHANTDPYVSIARLRRREEDYKQRILELEELAQYRANGHSKVTNGAVTDGESPVATGAEAPSPSYEEASESPTPKREPLGANNEAIGHLKVTDGEEEESEQQAHRRIYQEVAEMRRQKPAIFAKVKDWPAYINWLLQNPAEMDKLRTSFEMDSVMESIQEETADAGPAPPPPSIDVLECEVCGEWFTCPYGSGETRCERHRQSSEEADP